MYLSVDNVYNNNNKKNHILDDIRQEKINSFIHRVSIIINNIHSKIV